MFGKTEELVVLLLIVLVLFGAKKLPELSRSIGQSVREVRKGFRDEPATPAVQPAEAEPVQSSRES